MNRRYLPTAKKCVVCGQPDINHKTLSVRWYVESDLVKTEFATSDLQMGYKGLIHGGIVSSLLDEALCWVAGVHCKQFFITGTLTVKFLQPIRTGATLLIVGQFHQYNGKYAECTGEVFAPELGLCAEASGRFFPIPRDQALAAMDYWVFQPGDLNILEPEE